MGMRARVCVGGCGPYGRLETILCSINLPLTCTVPLVRVFDILFMTVKETVERWRTLMTDSLRSFPTASRLGMDSFILKFIHLMWHCELLIEQWFLPKSVCVCELEHLLVMVHLPAS